MRAHLEALRAHLAPLDYSQHLLFASPLNDQDSDTVPPVPYLVLKAAWDYPDEIPACGTTESLDTSGVVICAASTAVGADVVAGRVRRFLSPGGGWTRVPMAGRTFDVKCTGMTEGTVDPDLRLPNSNRHPGVAHVLLRLHSEPA